MRRDQPPPNWVVYLMLILLIGAFISNQLTKIDRNNQEWGIAKNDLYHFSLEYPLKWRGEVFGKGGATKGLEKTKFRLADDYSPGFSITVSVKEYDHPKLEDVIQWGIQDIKKFSQKVLSPYTEISLENITLNEIIIARQVYLFDGSKLQDIYIAREHDMIIIELEADESQYDYYLPYFERVVESFTPKK